MLERAKDGAKFGQQIDDLLNATTGMQEDAQSLTKALKGDSQQQGAWGEQILETALEKAGLKKILTIFFNQIIKIGKEIILDQMR